MFTLNLNVVRCAFIPVQFVVVSYIRQDQRGSQEGGTQHVRDVVDTIQRRALFTRFLNVVLNPLVPKSLFFQIK